MLNVSTKTGDKGVSSLASGRRIPKDSVLFDALGTLDELNSWLGVVVAALPTRRQKLVEQKKVLLHIQDALFYLGAEVAQSPTVGFMEQELLDLEAVSDKLQAAMADGWAMQFRLPGGTPIAAQIDVARSVCRRAEREIVRAKHEYELRPLLLQYLNRLSDYLFVLRCFTNVTLGYKEKLFSASTKHSK